MPTSSCCQRRGTATGSVAASTITANAADGQVIPVSIACNAGASAAPTRPIAATISDAQAIAITAATAAITPASGRASQSGTRS